MSQAAIFNLAGFGEVRARARLALLLDRGLFSYLLLLIVFAPIPYGTSHPWWKAAFICLVMLGTIVAVVESLLSRAQRIEGVGVIAPIIVLCVFAYLQTIPLPSANSTTDLSNVWTAVSADPYQTRFVAFQLISLACVMLLVYRYVSTEQRIRTVILVVLGVAVTSAIYGILRQSVQRHTGFVLPILKPGSGYGQFINKNHFAFMMEMALGLCVGLIAESGVRRQQGILYLAFFIPIWTALVLSNSRGGIVAMLGQFAIALFLLSCFRPKTVALQSELVRFARSKAARAGMAFVLLLALIAGSIWIGGEGLLSNFELASSELSANDSATADGVTRYEIWSATLRTFVAHPGFGVGLGGYWVAITAYHDASGTMTPQEAHNDYLELLASGGIVGFGIAIWFGLVVFRRARANLLTGGPYHKAVCFGAVVGISGVALHSLFDFGLHMLSNALLFVVLLSLATSRVEIEALEKID